MEGLPYKDNLKSLKDEIKQLPTILLGNENIMAMTSGMNGGPWLLICTNKRVLYIDKKVKREFEIVDIHLDKISSITHSKKGMFGKLSITDNIDTKNMEKVSVITMEYFVNTVNKQRELYKEAKMNPTTQVINNVSTADELMKFKQLFSWALFLTKF